MDAKEELETVLDKLRETLKQMQKDPRCIEDNQFENAVQKLHAVVRDQSQRLTDLETDYFKNQAELKEQIAELDKKTDNLKNFLDKASTTLEIVGAIEQIVKFFHPFV